ncbi:hypothetical protein DFH09DRAFT_1073787 [Mycena vulgaris]|nr:hypothetical protein DFH09DRAFT_1073787 [Mycena vulgaris]
MLAVPTPVFSKSKDPQRGPATHTTPAPDITASEWASTEEGRKAFRRQFVFKNVAWDDKIAGGRGGGEGGEEEEPLDYVVRNHRPSVGWLEAKRDELAAIMADFDRPEAGVEREDLKFARGAQATYLVALNQQLAAPTPPGGEAYDRADELRQGGDQGEKDSFGDANSFDAVLTAHFPELLRICVKVNRLRQAVPPVRDDQWVTLVNRLISLAIKPFEWAILSESASDRPQAMPTCSTASPAPAPLSFAFPRTFTPTRAVHILRMITDHHLLTPRQQRALVAHKNANYTTGAVVPVLSAEVTASLADLPKAQAQSLYAGVQAVGIYRNLGEDRAMLTVSIAHGFAFPAATRRARTGDRPDVRALPSFFRPPGSSNAVFPRIQRVLTLPGGAPIDLGQLGGAVALFLMLHAAVETHVLAAFRITAAELVEWAPWLSLCLGDGPGERPPCVSVRVPGVEGGPVVDWRVRRLPKGVLAERQLKRKAKRREAAARKRRRREEEEEEEEDGEEEEEETEDEVEE